METSSRIATGEVMGSPEEIDEKSMRKKNDSSGAFTKAVLVIGTAGIIGYSMLKDKIFGNPRSKIRKGLFYATLAGLVLYKCQGDKIEMIYEDAKNNIAEKYVKVNELKKENRIMIDNITDKYLDEKSRNLELEKALMKYNMQEAKDKDTKRKDKLEKRKESYENIKEKLRGAIKEIGCFIFATDSYNILKNKHDDGRVDVENNFDLEPFMSVKTNSVENRDVFWILSNGNTYEEISGLYYNGLVAPETIREYNLDSSSIDVPLPFGKPIALIAKGLRSKISVNYGMLPQYVSADSNLNIEEILKGFYLEDSMCNNVLTTVANYNKVYGLHLNDVIEKSVKISGGRYSILIPGCLKMNDKGENSELQVERNAK